MQTQPTLSPSSIAARTFGYSVLLAAILQTAQTLTRTFLVIALALTSGLAPVLNLITVIAELATKMTWAVLICEALVLVTIFMRQRWLMLILGAVSLTFVAVFLGEWVRGAILNLFALVNSFDVQAALNASAYKSAKYFFLGLALAFVNRLTAPSVRAYLGAGAFGAMGGALLTFSVNANATLLAIGGELAVDTLFPLGCSLVVWQIRKVSAPLKHQQQELKAQLRAEGD